MKSLVAYYSLTGNCRLIAEAIAKEAKADLCEIRPKKEYRSMFSALFLGGFRTVLKSKPAIMHLSKDPDQYDLIIIGTPVWASTFAPPIRSFIASAGLKGKKIAFFCCYGGDKGKTFSEFKDLLTGNKFVGEIAFNDPMKKGKIDAIKRAKAWVREKIR